MDKRGGLECVCVCGARARVCVCVCVCVCVWGGGGGGGGGGVVITLALERTYISFYVVPKRTIACEAPYFELWSSIVSNYGAA